LSTPRTDSRERECALPKKPIKIEIVQEGQRPFLPFMQPKAPAAR
jgi:hypothetical protein